MSSATEGSMAPATAEEAGRPPAVEARGLTRTFESPGGGSIPVLREIDL